MNSIDINELFKSTTINEYLPDINECKGYMLGYRYNEKKNEIDNFEVRDSDIWVTSYPKAGTTWTQELVWLLANNLNYEGAKSLIPVRFPFLEMEVMFNISLLEKFETKENFHTLAHSIEYTRGIIENPRCIKTHLPWDLLPQAIQNKEKRPKIIHVMRNPKDTCVSYYHHSQFLQKFKGTFDEFATLFLNDKVLWSPYWDCIGSYWLQRNEPNVLIIKYEDMKRDLKAEVLKVAQFLDKSLSDDDLEKLIYHLSFDAMRENVYINKKNFRRGDTGPRGEFLRKGITGDYKNYMSNELNAKFDRWSEEKNNFKINFF